MAAVIMLSGCAGTPVAPPDSLYLAEVIGFPFGKSTRAMILESGEAYQRLVNSKISDDDIRDGSLERGRVFCCGGPNEGGWTPVFYVPYDLGLELGDIVEIRAGVLPDKISAGTAHIVTRVVLAHKEKTKEASCRWDPPNERLWLRVIYCDWMLADGWVKERGIGKPWYKLTGSEVKE
ncbi:MAG: hypothetical protein K9K86_05725 [Pseudomonadales bacterium]|nr:hypothetical protein [Pseudomonadales bacterium]